MKALPAQTKKPNKVKEIRNIPQGEILKIPT
jgi:hypothetical protein